MMTPNTIATRPSGQQAPGPAPSKVQSLHLDRGYCPPDFYRADAILREMIASGGVTR